MSASNKFIVSYYSVNCKFVTHGVVGKPCFSSNFYSNEFNYKCLQLNVLAEQECENFTMKTSAVISITYITVKRY